METRNRKGCNLHVTCWCLKNDKVHIQHISMIPWNHSHSHQIHAFIRDYNVWGDKERDTATIKQNNKKTQIFPNFFRFVSNALASCLSYGHSCWGAHGKRSSSNSRIENVAQERRWPPMIRIEVNISLPILLCSKANKEITDFDKKKTFNNPSLFDQNPHRMMKTFDMSHRMKH